MRQIEKKPNSYSLPELLAPAGSFAHLTAAIKAGADAVYMGGQRFGARAYADNFTGDNLVEALHYAHFYGKRLYLTVNTLMKEKELEEDLHAFLLPFYEEGLDGVIVQDPGAAAFIRQHFPGMEIHGSTQMTITDSYGAKAAARLGMNRVVPARELSLPELVRIKKETGLELEVFIHGALCYCYSGQCLLSSMYGGRSGNRGRCAQPCRLPYQLQSADGTVLCPSSKSQCGSHLLSPKDLCALLMLPELIRAGVDSLKIEGRMKNVEYVAGVTAIYRKYLDRYREDPDRWQLEPEDMEALEELYSRTGFTDGYWHRHNGPEIMATLHPRNLGRKIGQVRQVRKGQIGLQLSGDVRLKPKDILVIPFADQEEMILTVPEKLREEKGLFFLNVPAGRRVRAGMDVFRRRSEALAAWIQNDILKNEKKYPVQGEITIKTGEPAQLVLHCQNETVSLSGAMAQPSQKRPVTAEDISRQLHKTGQVPFYLESLETHLQENVFLPMSAVKELRQNGFAKLQRKMEKPKSRKDFTKISLQSEVKSDTVISLNNRDSLRNNREEHVPDFPLVPSGDKKQMAVVYDRKMFFWCLSHPFFDSICLPMNFWKEEELPVLAEQICREGKKAFLSLPQILRADAGPSPVSVCSLSFWSGIYAHNLGQAEFLWEIADRTAPILASGSFYQWNHRALLESWRLFSLAGAVLPAELSWKECVDMLTALEWEQAPDSPGQTGAVRMTGPFQKETARMTDFFRMEVSVYGRIPLMRSANCLKKTRHACDHRQEILYLSDRKGRQLPVVTHCDRCYNTIWTDRPISLIGQPGGELIRSLHGMIFHFFLDDENSAAAAVKAYQQWQKVGFHSAGKREPEEHWNYGIE